MQNLLLKDLIALHTLSENANSGLYLFDGDLQFRDPIMDFGEGVNR